MRWPLIKSLERTAMPHTYAAQFVLRPFVLCFVVARVYPPPVH